MLRAAAVVFVISMLTTVASAQHRIAVEGIAALVGGAVPRPGVDIILRSDVELSARLALSGVGDSAPPNVLRASLDELIAERLIAREADRLRARAPSAAEVAAELGRIEARVGGAARLRALLRAVGAEPQEVQAIAERRAYVGAFLRANLQGARSVSDDEVRRVFDEGEHPFVGETLDDARPALREWLSRQALNREVERWVGVLRSRTLIRIVARWD